MAFPKLTEAILKDDWRTLPFAVEEIYAHCKPMRFNPSAPADHPEFVPKLKPCNGAANRSADVNPVQPWDGRIGYALW
ncbi:hypothetical protein Rhsp01_49240 [Rhizobium sp. NBRC 114257]|uniref:Uncharacterized protein n=1 Tax=Rhizobium dioscoreae TaxID=2653122 RepID=A0ABQ0ZAZ0_9HYPH|nr:hypothetical protein RsS93_50370 [Rhizobium dioscoreae]GLU83748.1 hypothetical protein Rhsp01_49240 [Rhizobium sp. NBRC 114257]